MNLVKILFLLFTALAAGSALAIVFSKSVFKSALYLLVTLLAIAGIYVLAFAEFVAVTQVMVYAGGILVLIIFGIMLTTKISGRALVVGHKHILSGVLAGVILLALLARYLPGPLPSNHLMPRSISDIGLDILSEYSLPFEVAGLLLLLALVGAAVITAHLKSPE